jgi:biopolymer transport protein TolR
MHPQPVRRPRKKRMSEINVVPYIDVMLVLLVIFMITTPLLTEGVKVELPQADASPVDTKDEEPIIVSINKKGQFFLNLGKDTHKPITNSELIRRVKTVLKHRTDKTVYVKGDKKVEYGKVVIMMALLKKSGIEHVGLVTRLDDTGR